MFLKSLLTVLKILWVRSCHYFSSPGLSWDIMLEMTGVKLEKILDICKYLFIEKGLPSKKNAGILKQYSRGIQLAFQR